MVQHPRYRQRSLRADREEGSEVEFKPRQGPQDGRFSKYFTSVHPVPGYITDSRLWHYRPPLGLYIVSFFSSHKARLRVGRFVPDIPRGRIVDTALIVLAYRQVCDWSVLRDILGADDRDSMTSANAELEAQRLSKPRKRGLGLSIIPFAPRFSPFSMWIWDSAAGQTRASSNRIGTTARAGGEVGSGFEKEFGNKWQHHGHLA